VISYVFLGIGIICILIGRILLLSAAFGVSVWWGLGIFLPFGPLLFRLSYPDLAPMSRTFRLVALPCILAYFILRPGPPNYDKFFKQIKSVPSGPANHYATEKHPDRTALEESRAANDREFNRLTEWSEALHLKKRDLLRSDVQGNAAYDSEAAAYNAALAKANAEKSKLWPQK
jgi:hypothetical protein